MKNIKNKILVRGNISEVGNMRFSTNISRRRFIKNSLTALAAPLIFGCSNVPTQEEPVEPRLSARPGIPIRRPTKGLTKLGLNTGKDGILYVPQSYTPDKAMPLFVAMHGAGGESSNWAGYYAHAEARGMILMAPDSRGTTWDFIRGDYGPDLEFLDQALKYVFDYCNIDPTHLLLGGFSDGASYALSLGVSNGDLFSHLVGYSPGFMVKSYPLVGYPHIYISHGTQDSILPIESSRDYIVPDLLNEGYDVTYNEFEGGHQITTAVSKASLDWFVGVIEENGNEKQD